MIISSRFVGGCRDAFIASPSANACKRMPVVPSLITLIDAAFSGLWQFSAQQFEV